MPNGLTDVQIETINRANMIFRLHGVGDAIGAQLPTAAEKAQIEEVLMALSVDAFGRLRTSDPNTIFDSKQIYDAMPDLFDEELTGSGTSTHSAAEARSRLQTSTASGDKVIRQTKRYFNYVPGHSHLVYMTFNMNGSETNVEKRVGYFDGDNGVFLLVDGTGASFVVRSKATGSVVDSEIAQASWNDDPLDGTGDSGITLDLTKTQILIIDMEWLGVGTVRFGFVVDGAIVWAHKQHHANVETTVYMSTPNLPCRWEIENTGTASGTPYIDAICCTVISEGGHDPSVVQRSASNGTTGISVSTTLVPLITIRLKSAYIRATVKPLIAAILSTTTTNFYWQLVFNPTITGGDPASWNSVSNSPVEYDVSQTGTVSGGAVVIDGYASNNSDQVSIPILSALTVAADIGGISDELTLAVAALAAGSETLYGSITWSQHI